MTGKNTKKTRRKYDAFFKEDVLKLIASGRTVSDVAQSMGIGTHIIYRWIHLAKQSDSSGISHFQLPGSTSEIERLKAALHRARTKSVIF